jgi:acetyl esterase/lipase
MLVHGGSWRKYHKRLYRDLGRTLARAGYVAASVEYRLVPDGVFPRAVQDCGCALSYLRNHAGELGIDPDRIAVMGYSAGGHLVSLLGVGEDIESIQPDCAEGPTYPPAAVISGAGPQDLLALADADVVQNFIGGTLETHYESYVDASPLMHVHEGTPPFLFIHGSADQVVPIEQSRDMRDALLEVGTSAELLVVPLSGHVFQSSGEWGDVGFATSEDAPEAFIVLRDFLERTVGRP